MHTAKKRWLFYVLCSLLLVSWQWPLLFTTNSLVTGDFDYFTQAYEAVRQSILHYHEFPWVNAWIGGGVPLYANPQVGVFSLQTLLVLAFGAPYGLKLSIIVYSLIGFWSMFYLLTKTFKTDQKIATALSFVWVTNGFFVAHLVAHYSFTMFLVMPLLLHLLLNIEKRRYWLYLGIAAGLFALSAFHYAVFHGFLILGLCAAVIFIKNWNKRKAYLKLYLGAACVFLAIAGHRVLYTLEYGLDFPRTFADKPDSLITALQSFVVPFQTLSFPYHIINPGTVNYGWTEHTVFVGYTLSIVFLLLVSICLYGYVQLVRKYKSQRQAFTWLLKNKFSLPLALLVVFVLFLLISLGEFSQFSPYALLQHLPAFSSMRVSSRWLIWAVLVGLIFIGVSMQLVKNPKLRNVLVVLVIIGAFEVYISGFGDDKFYQKPLRFRGSSAPFEQFEDFDHYNPPVDFNNYKVRSSYDRRFELYSYEATLNNLGQSRGYEPIVDTYYQPTLRCGIVQGCPFIKSKNAQVVSWAPNKIIIKRTDQKPIELNMNPSSYWLVNGQRVFASARAAEVLRPFIINDQAETITLQASPRSIHEMLMTKVRAR